MLRKVCELIIVVALLLGALAGLAVLIPPCGISVGGGAKISKNEVINFGFQIQKQIIIQRPIDRLRKDQLDTL